jgi:hypothetical protein
MVNVAEYTIKQIIFSHWQSATDFQSNTQVSASASSLQQRPAKPAFDLFHPLRQWLNRIEVNNPKLAHTVCAAIPAQCPFERDIKLFGRTLFHIPPMCKLNPLYEELVMLRFKALCYLVDECGEDISAYC